ncbi:ac57-like protein [Alphabaculovirus altersperidaniae]|uniref:Ac57-like protein n=1 Tax=Spodoptera eridania nucleopolyhedrovirus TaxID=2315721 RepID=A0ABX6TQA2_9ABAC|nr:ac57-like protein [Spodoptera eridania nucleopolyhedrovirus]QNV47896.1 ac57-like protein [Spodoptera eridania nucleopolyhedrovirus]
MRSCGDAPLVRHSASEMFSSLSSVNNKYLEFNGVSVDLRHVVFSADGLDDTEYIIFLNVCRAIYTNFKVYCNLSLESMAELLFEQSVCKINGCDVKKYKTLGECVQFNEHDHNKSLIIDLCEKTGQQAARIIVAKTIYFDENYHKRVSGYIDFENRHNKNYTPPTDDERIVLNREYEIKLLEFT